MTIEMLCGSVITLCFLVSAGYFIHYRYAISDGQTMYGIFSFGVSAILSAFGLWLSAVVLLWKF